MSAERDWRGEVLKFWFGLEPKQWWTADPALDHRIKEAFLELWSEQRQLPADSFLGNPLSALAAIILFDQFPRNMIRGHADQFSTDTLARAIANGAIDTGFDDRLEHDERKFLYMPLMHSEDRHDQQRSLALFTALGDSEQLRFARLHKDIIDRFGRFPHRNAMLGRAPRSEEVAAGDVSPW